MKKSIWHQYKEICEVSRATFFRRLAKGYTPERAAAETVFDKCRSNKKLEYAVYKGELLICIGTAKECSEEMGVLLTTFKFYLTPTYQKRLAKRKRARNYITIVELDDEE